MNLKIFGGTPPPYPPRQHNENACLLIWNSRSFLRISSSSIQNSMSINPARLRPSIPRTCLNRATRDEICARELAAKQINTNMPTAFAYSVLRHGTMWEQTSCVDLSDYGTCSASRLLLTADTYIIAYISDLYHHYDYYISATMIVTWYMVDNMITTSTSTSLIPS